MNNVTLKEAAAEARREYGREYRKRNKEKLDEYQRQWRKDHPDKVKEYAENYWTNRVLKSMGADEVTQQRVDV